MNGEQAGLTAEILICIDSSTRLRDHDGLNKSRCCPTLLTTYGPTLPIWGVISFSNILITSLAPLLRQGKVSGHPENVSTRTSRYLCCPHFGNSEKSICQYSLGVIPLFTSPAGSFLCILGLFTQVSSLCYYICICLHFWPYSVSLNTAYHSIGSHVSFFM